jgi:hypothetical protein
VILRATWLGVALALVGAIPALADDDAKAMAVIAAAKAATGGAAWDAIPGWHETGSHGGVAYEAWLDLRTWGMASQDSRGGLTQEERFDGQVVWVKSFDGHAGADQSAAALAAARQSDYLSARGYFFPDRFGAQFAYQSVQTVAKKAYDVVRVTPDGAGPVDLWFDQTTHLLAKEVIQGDAPQTILLDDYRKVGGIMAPYHLTVGAEEGHVGGVAFEPVDRARFSAPPGGE